MAKKKLSFKTRTGENVFEPMASKPRREKQMEPSGL